MTNFDLHQQKTSSIPMVIAIDYAGLPKFAKKTMVAGHQEERKTSTSKQEDYEGWLQLGFRSCTGNLGYAPIDHLMKQSVLQPTIEPNLFSGRPPTQLTVPMMVDNALVMDPLLPDWRDSSGTPNISNILQPAASTAYNSWQLGCPSRFAGEELSVFRPLPRQHIGVWLELRAAKNQLKKSSMLPQILKSYIRIKDVKMTVRLVMKYLANKLGLEDETEVEVTCRGLQLPPFLTLQQVRDSIWCSIDAAWMHYSGSLSIPDSPDIRPVMILEYSKSARCTDPVIG